MTSTAAAVGGALLIIGPDGQLLAADRSALSGTPFSSWRLPGLLLLLFVGGGFAAAAFALYRKSPVAGQLSVGAGAGLVAFEAATWFWLGFQTLEVLFILVGLLAIHLARTVS